MNHIFRKAGILYWNLQQVNNLNGTVLGHPLGGVTIMWDAKFESFIKPLDIKMYWCITIEIIIMCNL